MLQVAIQRSRLLYPADENELGPAAGGPGLFTLRPHQPVDDFLALPSLELPKPRSRPEWSPRWRLQVMFERYGLPFDWSREPEAFLRAARGWIKDQIPE